jgi:UDP-N-acetylmuramoylalanine--D-glutamate ligase
LGKNYLRNLADFEIIFVSPGVPLELPEIKSVKNKVKVSSEIELFFESCPAPIIGITGTNGKTTVTTLISKILKQSSKKVFTGGNIGESLINKLSQIKRSNLVVLELSSFQLETLEKSPNIAVVLNFTPDHLDRYKDFNNYKKTKVKIVNHQDKKDFAILNFDDRNTNSLRNKTKASVFGFSTVKILNRGAYLKSNQIIIKDKGITKKICKLGDIHLPGKHNIENVLAAVLVGYLCKISPVKIKKAIRGFKGIEHRLEYIRSINKRKFYNDSKATTPESTTAALNAFDNPIILIAGGYDKHADFSKMAKVIAKKVKHLILIGKTAKQIAKVVQQQKTKVQISLAKNLNEAVVRSYKTSQPNDIILLSPACASYDMFKNYEERGKSFKKLVNKL